MQVHVPRSQCWGFLNVPVPLLVAKVYLSSVVVLVQGILRPFPQKIFNCIRFEIWTQNASSPFPRHSVSIFFILPAGTVRLTGVLGKVFIVPPIETYAFERGAQKGVFYFLSAAIPSSYTDKWVSVQNTFYICIFILFILLMNI